MPDILDELAGIIGADAVTAIRNNPALSERLTQGEELRTYYTDAGNNPPPPRVQHTPPPSVTPPPTVTPSASVTSDLDKVLARLEEVQTGIATTVKAEVESMVTARGNELVNNAIAISMRNNRELNRIDARHRADFGEDLKDEELTAHIDAAQKAGRPFRTITDAYDDMTRTKREDLRVESRVREELKNRASNHVPGVSASTSASPMLRVLKSPGSTAGGAQSHVEKAAEALATRLAERGETVS